MHSFLTDAERILGDLSPGARTLVQGGSQNDFAEKNVGIGTRIPDAEEKWALVARES